jgi:hypothetical protein
MNFLKTFLITLVIYIGLNALFVLLAIFLVAGYPATDILYIIVGFFSPIAIIPGVAWTDNGIVGLINATPLEIVSILMIFLGLIIPPLVAIIVGARLGDNNQTGFGAWFTTALLASGVYAILFGIGQIYSANLYLVWVGWTTLYGELGAILSIFIAGVVNGFFYGCISLLLANKWI